MQVLGGKMHFFLRNAHNILMALCIGNYLLVRLRGLAMRVISVWRFASEIIYLRVLGKALLKSWRVLAAHQNFLAVCHLGVKAAVQGRSHGLNLAQVHKVRL